VTAAALFKKHFVSQLHVRQGEEPRNQAPEDQRSLCRVCVCNRHKLFPCLEFCTPFGLLISHSFRFFPILPVKPFWLIRELKASAGALRCRPQRWLGRSKHNCRLPTSCTTARSKQLIHQRRTRRAKPSPGLSPQPAPRAASAALTARHSCFHSQAHPGQFPGAAQDSWGSTAVLNYNRKFPQHQTRLFSSCRCVSYFHFGSFKPNKRPNLFTALGGWTERMQIGLFTQRELSQ